MVFISPVEGGYKNQAISVKEAFCLCGTGWFWWGLCGARWCIKTLLVHYSTRFVFGYVGKVVGYTT